MPTQDNRSSAPSPEQLGQENERIAAAVKEAVTAAISGLLPMFEKMALTPEKLNELKKPFVDPEAKLRELRERLLWREDEEGNRKRLQDMQDHCPHLDDNGRSSIQLMHNWPDRQPRGLCIKCMALIFPKEWRISAPEPGHPRGKAYLVEPHPLYNIVMQLQSRN